MLYVTIHETGNPDKGANAKAHSGYLKGNDAANAPVSWHYTVDDTVIYQHLPENEDAYHSGDGAGNGNRQSIGIEICVNSDGDFLRAVDNAVELVADICIRRNIPISNVRQHYDWSGKNCPQNIRAGKPYNWSAFVDKVKAAIEEQANPPLAFLPGHEPSDWAKEAWAWALGNKITDGTNPTHGATREQAVKLLHNYHCLFGNVQK
jgi:N-acetylmuramoyl-L-alanine amidase